MNYTFTRALAPHVASGRKCSTIRNCTHKKPRPGMPFTGTTGPRFRPQRLLRSTIQLVVPISLDLRGPEFIVTLGGQRLGEGALERLASLEGFDSALDMRTFFDLAHGPVLLPDDVWRWIVWGPADPATTPQPSPQLILFAA